MPAYCYTCESCGNTFEEVFEIAHRKQQMKCDCGSKANRDLGAEQGGVKAHGDIRVDSWALAVDPEDIAKTKEEDKRIGSTASEYLPTGQLRFTSPQQMRKYARDRGYIDRNSYL